MTSLDLSNNLNLQQLNCAENQLPSLDVSANGKLQQLYCNGNQLPSLNVAQNTNLTHLYCWNNQLTSLNVRALTKLQYLSCSFNQLTSLDLSQNTVLELLYGGYNALTSLDATHNPLLATLECHHNQLTSLSVNTNTQFKVLDCGYNRFGWATLDALSALEGENIVLSPQVLPSLDVNLNEAVDFSAYATYNGRSTVFSLGDNTPASAYTLENGILKLKSSGVYTVNMSNPGVTFKGNPVIISRELIAWPGASDTLRWVVMDSVNQLHLNAVCDASFVVDWGDGKKETVSVSGQSYNDDIKHSYAAIGEYAVTVYGLKHFMLLHLSLRSNVQSLDVRACPFLEFLECESHQLSSLDVSKNTALTVLNVSGNRLSSLDVSKNTALTTMYCSDNQLTSLDVTKNTALTYLDCSDNQLTSLDVSKNTALKTLYCGDNQLSSLDVHACPLLETLLCASNQLTALNLSQNTALTYLYCTNNQLTSLDLSQNTALGNLYCYGNRLGWADLDALSKLELVSSSIWPQSLSLEADLNEAVLPAAYASYNGQQTVCNLDHLSPSSYTLANGNVQFNTFGVYMFSMSNPAVKTRDGESVLINCEVSVWPAAPDTVRWIWKQQSGTEVYVNLGTRHDEGFIVNWGDGTVEKSEAWYQISHTYAESGEYTVTVYGVNHWLLLSLELYGQPNVKSLDVSACPYLETLVCNGGELMSLDLSKNTALKSLGVYVIQLTTLEL